VTASGPTLWHAATSLLALFHGLETTCGRCASACGKSGRVELIGNEVIPRPSRPSLRRLPHLREMLYQAKDTNVDPVADDLASLGLDVLVAEAGWAAPRAQSALLLVG